MTSDTALYIGEAGKVLQNGAVLIPGVTVANVPEGEAIASDLWSPIDPARPTESLPPSIFDGGTVSGSPFGAIDGGTP
jgi:hypothetical protein